MSRIIVDVVAGVRGRRREKFWNDAGET